LIDIESFCKTLKIKWINSLLSKSFANWRLIPILIFDRFGSNFLFFYMNIQTTKHLSFKTSLFSPFYTDIIKAWILFKNSFDKKPKHFTEIHKQILGVIVIYVSKIKH